MIKLSFLNLFRRKTRTFLSVAGIAIGVAAILVLVSLVDGFTVQFDSVISQFKGISVYEKDASDIIFSSIDESFVDRIGSLPGVKAVIPEIWFVPSKIDSSPVSLASVTAPTVYGLDITEYYSSNASGWIGDVEKGSSLRESDRGSVLVGKKIEVGFDKFVGSPIRINGKPFKVKGVLMGGSELTESVIVMNLADAKDLSFLPAGKISSLTVTLNDFSKDKKVADLIELKYGEKLKAFTQAEFSEQFTGIIGNLRLLAVAVAVISSVVAGIGIANTMLMSVLERFREIGALKAVGWTSGEIMKMVLYESLILGVFGGFAGLCLGFAVDFSLAALFGVSYSVSLFLILSSFLFALFLGVFSGIYPAIHASRLDPVEALRS